MLKKEILLKLMDDKKIKGFTILGVPTFELIQASFNNTSLMDYLKSKNIDVQMFKYDRTDIGIYFPEHNNKTYIDVCSISVSKNVSKEQLDNIISLFIEVEAYYQANVPPIFINKILGIYENEPFTFDDMLMLIPDSQTDIASKIGKSRQTITDMKSGKSKCSIEVLASLMKEYPLLPYDAFIKSFTK